MPDFVMIMLKMWNAPVAYLEAIYIDGEHRLLGYAHELVKRCEDWGRERGTKEFASDCILTNTDSYKFP